MGRHLIIKIYIFFGIFISTEARSRFSRQIRRDDGGPEPEVTLVAPPPEPSRSIQPPRLQRELFTLSGPSLDFQKGSVVPAPLPIRTGDALRTLRHGLDDDYNEFGSRLAEVDSPAAYAPPRVLPGPPGPPRDKKPIYVVPYVKNGTSATLSTSDADRGDGSDRTTTSGSEDGTPTEYYLETTTTANCGDNNAKTNETP